MMERFDGLDLRQIPGAEFELRHPGTGEGMGYHITVQGYDSEAVDDAGQDVRRKALKAKDKTEAEDVLRGLRVARAQAAVLTIRDDKDPESTAEGFRNLLVKPGFIWAVEQIEAFAGDRASFFKNAESN